MAKKYFYDTNAILENYDKLFENSESYERFVISSQTLMELENIKSSSHKDADIKYKARKACRVLDENIGKYDVSVDNEVDFGLPQTPDNIIMTGAYRWNRDVEPIVFVTSDIACRIIANKIYELDVESICEEDLDNYTGFKEVMLSENDMAYFYEHLDENIYNCLIGEYLVVKDLIGEVVDVRKWNGLGYIPIWKKTLKTIAFGDKIKAKDVFQQIAIDSIMTNTITAITGKAGSGKSLLSLVSAMYLVEIGKYDRIVVLFNPTKTKGSADMGFYSGDALSKAMQNSIGQILTTKFGDRYTVDALIAQDKLKLVSMADARGFEVRDSEILYISESQNTSVELLKLCLSRASQGCKIIIEGDFDAQVDSYAFQGHNNGMKRAIDVLKNEDIFGFVELQNVYRSKIAELVDKM